jgi:hypothetical protein
MLGDPPNFFSTASVNSDHICPTQNRSAEALSQASGVLNDRERHILEASRLAEIPITLRGLPEEFGLWHESVRLIGVRALENVQTAVKNGVAAIETSVPPAALERVALRLTIPFMWVASGSPRLPPPRMANCMPRRLRRLAFARCNRCSFTT